MRVGFCHKHQRVVRDGVCSTCITGVPRWCVDAATLALFALIVHLLTSCAPPATFRASRVCVFDRNGRGLFRTATVIDQREDGARRVQYDDSTAGDNGFQWIEENDSRLVIRRCAASNPLGDFSAENPQPRKDTP